MKVKFILPALTEAKSPYWRPIKYSLFPPLGLATLAAYLSPDDEAILQDEHVEEIYLHDPPDLVVIQVYINNAYREFYSWQSILKGSFQHDKYKHMIKHLAYAGGWKKFEPLWNFMIKTRHFNQMLPLLEVILSKVNKQTIETPDREYKTSEKLLHPQL